MKDKLSIVIVSFNVKNLLKECVESLIQESRRNRDLEIEIIIIDNASKDGTAKLIENLKFLPAKRQGKIKNLSCKFKVVLNKKNLGFAKAVNQGIKIAKGDYILLLNPDTRVKTNALEKLLEFAKSHPKAGVIGAKLINPDGSIQPSVYHFPTIKRAVLEFWLGKKGTYEKYAPKTQKPKEVEAVTGAVMLIPKKVIQKVGLFDQRYFMYFEDLDYCRRVKKTGFKVYYLPATEFIHHHGASGKTVPQKTYKWLVESSKIYHGKIKYYLLTFIIWLGQKWRRIIRKN